MCELQDKDDDEPDLDASMKLIYKDAASFSLFTPINENDHLKA